MSLIQNNATIGASICEIGVMGHQSGIGCKPDRVSISTAGNLRSCAMNIESTVTEFLSPRSIECWGTDNECPQSCPVLDETDDLEGLSETHVICQNTATAPRCISTFTA
jgi:hypothetical protein